MCKGTIRFLFFMGGLTGAQESLADDQAPGATKTIDQLKYSRKNLFKGRICT